MSSSQRFCANCGKPLRPAARFCQACGSQVSTMSPGDAMRPESPILVVPPAPRRGADAGKLPLAILALVVAFLLLVLVGGAVFWGVWGRTRMSDAAVNYLIVTPTRPPSSGTPLPASSTIMAQVPIATGLPGRTTEPLPTATLPAAQAASPTLPPTPPPASPTAAPKAQAAYDLYVKRINYTPAGADLVVGQRVRFIILIATDIYPESGPLFPTARFRWRPAANLEWTEALCPADTHYAKCDSTFEYTYGQPGAYAVEVEVDHRGEVAETNEGNNNGRLTLQLNAPKPTLAPKPKPAFSPVTFSSAFDEDNQVPVNPGKVFPYGVTIIYSYWTYSGVVADTPFEFDWYRDGVRVDGSGENFINTSGKAFQWHNYGYTPKDPLLPGNYEFQVRVNSQVVLSGNFVIQPPQVGGPVPGALSLFFTIQNGKPTGWVYDKQGLKHSPEYGTIGDIHVSPGDRIVLQTNSPRFSLLFDCSTTPGTFDPCDFSADSTASLPKEIRAVKLGMSAFLNISRGDNRAGFRPGFEPQHYPADPILRIMFSW